MTPKRLFWLFDLCAAFVAFWLAHSAWPVLHAFSSPPAVRRPSRIPAVRQPPVDTLPLPPFAALEWMLFILAPALVVCLAILDAHAPLLTQSRVKIIGTAALSATASTAVLTMILFASRRLEGSRLLIFSFAVTGCSLRCRS